MKLFGPRMSADEVEAHSKAESDADNAEMERGNPGWTERQRARKFHKSHSDLSIPDGKR